MSPGMDQYRGACFSLGDRPRRQGLALVRSQRPRAPDLPDYARFYAAVLYPINDVADNLLRQFLHASLIHVFGMDRANVETCTHDDVNA